MACALCSSANFSQDRSATNLSKKLHSEKLTSRYTTALSLRTIDTHQPPKNLHCNGKADETRDKRLIVGYFACVPPALDVRILRRAPAHGGTPNRGPVT